MEKQKFFLYLFSLKYSGIMGYFSYIFSIFLKFLLDNYNQCVILLNIKKRQVKNNETFF